MCLAELGLDWALSWGVLDSILKIYTAWEKCHKGRVYYHLLYSPSSPVCYKRNMCVLFLLHNLSFVGWHCPQWSWACESLESCAAGCHLKARLLASLWDLTVVSSRTLSAITVVLERSVNFYRAFAICSEESMWSRWPPDFSEPEFLKWIFSLSFSLLCGWGIGGGSL